jgi:hypothetical protein
MNKLAKCIAVSALAAMNLASSGFSTWIPLNPQDEQMPGKLCVHIWQKDDELPNVARFRYLVSPSRVEFDSPCPVESQITRHLILLPGENMYNVLRTYNPHMPNEQLPRDTGDGSECVQFRAVGSTEAGPFVEIIGLNGGSYNTRADNAVALLCGQLGRNLTNQETQAVDAFINEANDWRIILGIEAPPRAGATHAAGSEGPQN